MLSFKSLYIKSSREDGNTYEAFFLAVLQISSHRINKRQWKDLKDFKGCGTFATTDVSTFPSFYSVLRDSPTVHAIVRTVIPF